MCSIGLQLLLMIDAVAVSVAHISLWCCWSHSYFGHVVAMELQAKEV